MIKRCLHLPMLHVMWWLKKNGGEWRWWSEVIEVRWLRWVPWVRMSPVFVPYNHTSMQRKITFMYLWKIRILMMVFLYFSTTTVIIIYQRFSRSVNINYMGFNNYAMRLIFIIFLYAWISKYAMQKLNANKYWITSQRWFGIFKSTESDYSS
jgi:hypothetical protein